MARRNRNELSAGATGEAKARSGEIGGGKRGWGSDGEDEAVVGLTSAPPPAEPQSQGRAGKERGGRAGREASDGIMNTSVSPSVK